MVLPKQPAHHTTAGRATWKNVTTLAAFLELPEEKPALEFFDGMVSQKVSPQHPHGGLQFELGRLLYESAGLSRPIRIFTETRITYAGVSFVPDLIVYRHQRVPRDPDGSLAADSPVAPDAAVEIVSPGETLRSQRDRCRWYVEHGVRVALLVIPRIETVELFRPNREAVVLRGPDRVDLDDIAPGLGFVVSDLFTVLHPD